MFKLTFNELRLANLTRLPLFKNKHGTAAHSRPDGSDWTPSDWLGALMGEVGEFARVRIDYEEGRISFDEYLVLAGKELADIGTYLDLLAARGLDGHNREAPVSINSRLMRVIAQMGEFAEATKKWQRGDMGDEAYELCGGNLLRQTNSHFDVLATTFTHGAGARPAMGRSAPTPRGMVRDGLNLGEEIALKFNEVSVRVGCDVKIGI